MSLNFNEIDLILEELDLSNSFIQEIVQPSFDSLALYTYKPGIPKTVYISLASASCRICEVRRKITKNEKPLRFNELLRSKLKGARIVSCKQIYSERIIEIKTIKEGPIFVMPAAQEKFAKKKTNKDETSEPTTEELTLYIRLWSNAGNIFLCDNNNIILDSFYRRPKKNELTGNKFNIPLEPNKTQTKEFQIRDFKEIEEKYAQEHPDFPKLTFNQKVDIYYSETSTQASLALLLEQAEKWYLTHKNKQQAALERLEEKRNTFKNAIQWKHQGDLILANAYKLDGKSDYLECDDWDETNPTIQKKISIKIDPKKNAHENASIFYETYKKQTNGLENLEHDIELAKKELNNLEKKYNSLISEKNPVKLEQLIRKTQKPKQQEKSLRPGLTYEINGWTIFVGRDANENDELLRHHVKGFDTWFHTRDYPGGYVFIKNRPGKTIPLEIMLYAGNLAVYYSKARKNGSADLYYTQTKHLRRAKNGPKGLVLPTNEKNLFIKIDEQKLRKLEEYFIS